MKKIIKFLNVITEENIITQHVMAIGVIVCTILCISSLCVPFVYYSTTLIYTNITICASYIMYAIMYIVRISINSYKNHIKNHQEELELLQGVFSEIRKHPDFANKAYISINKKNKKEIEAVLLDFIKESKQYNNDYYNKLKANCNKAICLIDDLR